MSKWMMVALVGVLMIGYGCEKKASKTEAGKAGVEDVKKAAAEKTPDTPAAKGDPNAQAERLLNDITRQLEGVTSKETAEKAKATLAPLAAKLDEAMAGVKKLLNNTGSPSLTGMGQGLAEGMKGALGGSLKGAVDKVMSEIKRISGNEELLAPLKPVIDKIKTAVAM